MLPGRPALPNDVADKSLLRAPEVAIPQRTRFAAIQPNPFNPATTVSFELAADGLAADGLATIEVYDLRGIRVWTLVRGVLPTGRHEVTWNGRDERGGFAPSGVYFFRLLTADVTETRKAVLMK